MTIQSSRQNHVVSTSIVFTHTPTGIIFEQGKGHKFFFFFLTIQFAKETGETIARELRSSLFITGGRKEFKRIV